MDRTRSFPVLRLILASLVLALSCTLPACNRSPAASGKDPRDGAKPARKVETARAVERPVERVVSVLGALAAYDQATLSVKVPGRLQQMAVDLGSPVRREQLLAQIEPQDYQLRLQQAEALLGQARARLGLPLEGKDDAVDLEKTSNVKQAAAVLEEARKNRERVASLFQQGILSQSELETVDAAHEVALNRFQDALEEASNRQALLAQRRAEVEIARQQLADTVLRAPFDGAVQERRANVGEYLMAGAPVIALVRVDLLRLRLEVPEREAMHVRAGQTVRLTVEGDTTVHTGEIKRLSPMISEQTRMLVVEADVPNTGSLRPGLFARAEIVANSSDLVLTVPRNALVVFAGVEKVFLVREGKAVEKPVTSGRRAADWVEIVSGLKAGDVVVLAPGSLQTGQAVATAK